jgi:hypothetical protein
VVSSSETFRERPKFSVNDIGGLTPNDLVEVEGDTSCKSGLRSPEIFSGLRTMGSDAIAGFSARFIESKIASRPTSVLSRKTPRKRRSIEQCSQLEANRGAISDDLTALQQANL